MSYDMIDRFLRNNLGDDAYEEYSAALDAINTPFTDREKSILKFTIHNFIHDAYSRMNAAAQDKINIYFKKGDVERFHQDAKDAEELLKKL